MTALLSQRTLWSLVAARAAATPHALFAVDERERRMTFAEFECAALRCAAGLAALGVRAESRVSWQLPTRLEAMLLCAALARLGAVQNPILPILREREVGSLTRQLGATLLCVPRVFRGFDHEAMARKLAAERPDLGVLVVEDALPEADPALLPPPPSATTPDAAPVRWILYSSGTTADPKGARHTDHSLVGPGRSMCEVLELTAADRSAFVFPFTHVGGIGWLFAGLMAGFAHVLVETFDPKRTPEVLAKQGVTQAGAGTVFHQAYLAAQRARGAEPLFPGLRSFPGGGAPKPPQLFFDLRAATGAKVVSGYGLTEYPIAVMGCVRDPDQKLAHTEGRATRGTEIRIVRLDESEAATGEEGEVRLRGPHLMRGYVDAQLDAEAFDARGFLRSGDLGRLDAEGYLTITGRIKDVIIRKGENISAKEVEDHLFAHPKVADVAVIGLADSERGERVCAVVVSRNADDPLRFEEMSAFLRGRGLAVQKLPEQLEHAEALPRNAAGKLVKRELVGRFS